tara:strand:- start:1268 stop:1951 length:684 start_codon:yes stop_codon:yes gene_type:complete
VTVRLDDSVIKFPSYDLATNGILAIGGNLSKEWLILAYTKGIFPFFNSDSDEISWWFPETRAVMEPGDMKVNKSLKKCINKKKFQIKADQNFSKVIKLCASTRRAYSGTWITENMIDAYCKLHQCNIAHSIEVYEDNNLVGGLYGIAIGKIFFGESMFHLKDNASKVAFYYLNKYLLEKKFDLIDCQFVNEHLLSLGAKIIDSDKFLKILNSAVAKNELDKKWNVNF